MINLALNIARSIAGRRGWLWRWCRIPRLRYLIFRDPVDFVFYSIAVKSRPATVIQVGSNDGASNDPLQSVIRLLAPIAVLVEPIPYVFSLLSRRYKGNGAVALENVAMSSQSGDRDIWFLEESSDSCLPPWYNQIASFEKEHLLKHRDMIPDIDHRIRSCKVPTLTFEGLCRRHQIEHIHILHIDAEGADAEILASIPLDQITPDVILFEHVHLSANDRNRVLSLLKAANYRTLPFDCDTLAVQESAFLAIPGLSHCGALLPESAHSDDSRT